MINKCSSDVCSVRLDFETFQIMGPTLTTEAAGGACVDSFVASGTSGATTPVICGLNSGQHSKYPSIIYSRSISLILEHEFFCLGRSSQSHYIYRIG